MKLKRLLSLLLCGLMLSASTVTAYGANTAEAAQEIDVTRDCSLTVSYAAAAEQGVTLTVKLHQIADISPDFQYTLLEGYPSVELNGISNQEEWKAVADTLTAYITADAIAPSQTMETDALGQATFQGLGPGLYYVEGCTFTSGDITYTYPAFLAAVPELQEDGTWSYNVTAIPKHTQETPDSEEKKYTVAKVWKTKSGASHPSSVEVELYRDGKLAETLTLSKANNWMYTWTDDTNALWTAVERNVPEGYTVSITGDQVITIVNSAEGQRSGSRTPHTGDTRPTWLYILLLAVSGGALVTLALRRKNRE